MTPPRFPGAPEPGAIHEAWDYHRDLFAGTTRREFYGLVLPIILTCIVFGLIAAVYNMWLGLVLLLFPLWFPIFTVLLTAYLTWVNKGNGDA